MSDVGTKNQLSLSFAIQESKLPAHKGLGSFALSQRREIVRPTFVLTGQPIYASIGISTVRSSRLPRQRQRRHSTSRPRRFARHWDISLQNNNSIYQALAENGPGIPALLVSLGTGKRKEGEDLKDEVATRREKSRQ